MEDDIKVQLEQTGMLALFQSLPPSHQNEYLKWIREAKKAETRRKRILKTIEMLKAKSD